MLNPSEKHRVKQCFLILSFLLLLLLIVVFDALLHGQSIQSVDIGSIRSLNYCKEYTRHFWSPQYIILGARKWILKYANYNILLDTWISILLEGVTLHLFSLLSYRLQSGFYKPINFSITKSFSLSWKAIFRTNNLN